MEYIQYALKVLMVVFIYIVITKAFRRFANNIGEQLGFGNFFLNLWQKIRRKLTNLNPYKKSKN